MSHVGKNGPADPFQRMSAYEGKAEVARTSPNRLD
jgi:hypothetical protein